MPRLVGLSLAETPRLVGLSLADMPRLVGLSLADMPFLVGLSLVDMPRLVGLSLAETPFIHQRLSVQASAGAIWNAATRRRFSSGIRHRLASYAP